MVEVCFDLPEDIIVNILCRLPLKSILRFKCVSKRWRSILSDPKFAISQFNLATEHQTLSRRVLFGTSSGFNSLDFDAPSLSFGDASLVRKLTFPLQQSGQHVRLAASCNGLVFAVVRVDLPCDSHYYDYQTSYYIWNPSLGFLRKLPDPRFSLLYSGDELNDASFGYGFGYVAATDDYKILLSSTCCECDGFNECYKFEVKIFSSIADTWTTIELPEREYHLLGDQGIFVNEALHWTEEVQHEEEGNRILVFNLANEEFRVLQLRFLDEDEAKNGYPFSWPPRVTVVGGCLGVLRATQYADGECIDTWVMREYDVGDSWKLCRSIIPSAEGLATFLKVFFVEDGVLVRMSFSVRSNNINLVKYEQTEAKRFHHGHLYNVLVCSGQYTQERTGDLYGERMVRYDESLLWLNEDHGAKDQKNQNLNEGMKTSCKIKEE